MNDTPLVSIEQSFVLRLSAGEAGALLGSLDRSAITGTPVARIYDALADATRYSQRAPRITPLSDEQAPRHLAAHVYRTPAPEQPTGGPGCERAMFDSLERNIGTSGTPFIDDPLS